VHARGPDAGGRDDRPRSRESVERGRARAASTSLALISEVITSTPMSSNSTSTSIAHHHVESAMEENVRAIKAWEYRARNARRRAEALSDWITAKAASGPVLVIHVIWFAAWIAVNAGAIRGIAPFDPFPFPFLTMAVSLEAIFLALFVLASQNRLARQADKRSHLDLQIDLLAEREMTAVLQLLQ